MSARYELFRSSQNAQYYFRLKAGNSETILQSEGPLCQGSWNPTRC